MILTQCVTYVSEVMMSITCYSVMDVTKDFTWVAWSPRSSFSLTVSDGIVTLARRRGCRKWFMMSSMHILCMYMTWTLFFSTYIYTRRVCEIEDIIFKLSHNFYLIFGHYLITQTSNSARVHGQNDVNALKTERKKIQKNGFQGCSCGSSDSSDDNDTITISCD